MKKTLNCFVATAMLLTMLAGCSDSSSRIDGGAVAAPSRLVNTQEISMERLKTVSISYTSENVTFLDGDADKIIVKEYMTVDKPQYYAAISQSDGSLKVTAGERPKGLDTDALRANVEIYLPTAYQGELSVETSSGNILSEQSLALSKLQANSKSGSVTFGDITAATISVGATSGAAKLGAISGDCQVETSSGTIQIADVSGAGSFVSESGDMHIGCNANVGNLTANASSGSIELTIPENLGFQFSATTNSGAISAPFSDQLGGTEKEVTGAIGTDATITIELSTTSGNIEVK